MTDVSRLFFYTEIYGKCKGLDGRSLGSKKRFQINGLAGGILIPYRESFDFKDLFRGWREFWEESPESLVPSASEASHRVGKFWEVLILLSPLGGEVGRGGIDGSRNPLS
jgi:hypothetical protein